MFRDDAKAFASDALAVELAKEALSDWDEFSVQERSFVVMPFMHSEALAVHDWAAKWFDEPGLERRKKYELLHSEIIERFGRYPHRKSCAWEELPLLKKKHSYKNIQDFNKMISTNPHGFLHSSCNVVPVRAEVSHL